MVAMACNNMPEGLEYLPHTPNVIQNATGHDCIALDLYMKASAKKRYNLADLGDFEGFVDLYPCLSEQS